MQVKNAILQLFLQLEDVLEQLSDDEYNARIEALSGATIGQHFRHVIECFMELEKGYHRGYVNYDLRKRDRDLETNRRFALRQMSLVGDSLEKPDKPLILVMATGEDVYFEVPTNYYRELVHNLDHTVHHMALMRIGILTIPDVQPGDGFGVAYSTMKYRRGRNILKKVATVAMFFLMLASGVSAQPSPHTTEQSWNLSKSGLAIEGYDPVAYFVSGKAIEGKKEYSYTINGVMYEFSSAQNRDLFKAAPAKYQPQYGGWCAYAMGAKGEKVEIDPGTFKVLDGKLYLFYNKYFNNTLKSWNKDEANLKMKADANWAKINH